MRHDLGEYVGTYTQTLGNFPGHFPSHAPEAVSCSLLQIDLGTPHTYADIMAVIPDPKILEGPHIAEIPAANRKLPSRSFLVRWLRAPGFRIDATIFVGRRFIIKLRDEELTLKISPDSPPCTGLLGCRLGCPSARSSTFTSKRRARERGSRSHPSWASSGAGHKLS